MTDKPKQTRVIALGNQKGGVGKSTNTGHIAACLGEMGYSCLIIDLDGNCGATSSFGLPTDWQGIFEAMLGEGDAKNFVLTNEEEGIALPQGVSLLAGNEKMGKFEEYFRDTPEARFGNPVDAIKAPLDQLMGHYDYIFLDTAPNRQSPTLGAYKFADWFILTSTPDRLGTGGLIEAVGDIDAARRSGGNTNLSLLGVILCRYEPNTRTAEAYLANVKKSFENVKGYGVFKTGIQRAVGMQDAQDQGQTMLQYAPKHKVTGQFRELTQEIIDRIEDDLKSRAVNENQSIAGDASPAEGVANAG